MPRPHPETFSPDWPSAEIGDVAAETARRFAVALRIAMGEQSSREVGRRCGLDGSTIVKILAGKTWPDLRTIALLEAGLGVSLWPGSVAHEHDAS